MNNKQTYVAPTKESLREGLLTVPVALNVSGLQFTETVRNLCTKIETAFREFTGLTQLIQVGMKPETDRVGLMTGLVITFYIDTNLRGEDGVYLTRAGRQGGNQDGTIFSLRGVNNVTRSGGFEPSENFKAIISPFVLKQNPNDKNLPISMLKDHSNIACIRMDPFAVFDLLLGIGANDPYSTDILSAVSLGGNYADDFDNYAITFTKTIQGSKYNKKRKTAIDCTQLDPMFNRGRNRNRDDRGRNNYDEQRNY